MWIIRNMHPLERHEKITVRLSDEENSLLQQLTTHLGIDQSGVMRQGLLKLAREEGIVAREAARESKPKPAPKPRPAPAPGKRKL